MTESTGLKKRGYVSALLIVVAAALIISPAYVSGYLASRGRISVPILALLSLAMFLVGAFLMIRLLRE
jgi:hypothetical protein